MTLNDLCDRLYTSGYGCVAGYQRRLVNDPAYAVQRAVAEGHDNVIDFIRHKQASARLLLRARSDERRPE